MSFQWIIDNAVDVQIKKTPLVAQTISRDRTVRAVDRGGAIWRFVVTPSPGLRWADSGVRAYISDIEVANKFTPQLVNFGTSNSGLAYLFKYQGSYVSADSTWVGTVTRGSNTITSVNMGSLPGGYKFKKGDIIQPGGDGKPVYMVTSDVLYSSTSVPIHRPAIGAGGTLTGWNHGITVNWRVVCTNLPQYKITPLGIIEWDGAFEFYEVPDVS